MLDLCIQGMGDDMEVHKLYPHKMEIGPWFIILTPESPLAFHSLQRVI